MEEHVFGLEDDSLALHDLVIQRPQLVRAKQLGFVVSSVLGGADSIQGLVNPTHEPVNFGVYGFDVASHFLVLLRGVVALNC
tara:strand:- start:1860 stop:2105 length:246 start_codon:yes stop_codon:yes gene_type:complete